MLGAQDLCFQEEKMEMTPKEGDVVFSQWCC